MKAYWSNCLVEALWRKLKHPKSITLKVLRKSGIGFHVFWYDRKKNVVRHFTHNLAGRAAFKGNFVLFFRGIVETINVDRFNRYCMTHDAPNLIITG